jgi:hypothetical protein
LPNPFGPVRVHGDVRAIGYFGALDTLRWRS